MLLFEPPQFINLLSGQTRPARFAVGSVSWVFRYPTGAAQQLRLASEFVGYRIASWLDVPVPAFCLARSARAFQPPGSDMRIPAGLGTATRWIEAARCPDLEHEPLEPFWEEERYLIATAAARVADIWMMNYDRRKAGNVVVVGSGVAPEVYFLDFDQAFLAKEPASPGRDRPHWISADFRREMLDDCELLSGFNGSGKVKSQAAQRHEHFDASVHRLRSLAAADVERAVRDIPAEWGISDSERRLWVDRLLARREIVLKVVEACGTT